MAAQISHVIAGEAALEKALSGLTGSLSGPSASGTAVPGASEHRSVTELRSVGVGEVAASFDFGCQGPDVFYHNRRTMPSALHYGALAHRRRFGSLVAGAAASLGAAERRPGSPRGAYLLGLATHAAIDRATHPFIIYFSGWARPSDPDTARLRGGHPFLERLLDLGLLEARLGMKARDFGLTERLGPAEMAVAGSAAFDTGLVELWSAGLRAAYPSATGKDASLELRIANALSDARHFYAMTDPAAAYRGSGAAPRSAASEAPLGEWLRRLGREEARRLVSIIYPEAIPEGLDPMNLGGAEWEDPSGDGRRSRASYLDLIEAGTNDAARAICLVLSFWRGELSVPALAMGIGDGGLALCDASGATLPPRVSRPLGLSEAMDAEYASRVDLSARDR